ncbi:ankyrin repeat domain-containing protein, partial [bacterium]|nr:ankyrin repeat domain-containing protein [bacterium]
LKANATKSQMESGFMWACEYGRNSVVELLLEKGVDLHAGENTDLTGLHWAVVGGQIEIIELLLQRGARPEALNVYRGTALSQALWCIANSSDEIDYVPIVEKLISAGSIIESGTLTWLAKQDQLSPATKLRLEDILKRYGAKS